jgi:hypothetical protein
VKHQSVIYAERRGRNRVRRAHLFAFSIVVGTALGTPSLAQGADRSAKSADVTRGSQYYHDLPLVEGGTSRWYDFVLQPPDFGPTRSDLGDLRLHDSTGHEVPYALRILRAESRAEAIVTREFNRSSGPDGSSQLALDLGSDVIEHNEVEVDLPGMGVRRRVRVDGSADGNDWHELATKHWLRFRVDDKEIEDRRIAYPPSRFRYVRVRVNRDPEYDEKAVAIGAVVVRMRVELPGELLTLPVTVGPREAVRTSDGPGSAWILGLGSDHVPCERISVEIADEEFARNYRVEAAGPEGSSEPFRYVVDGLWRRRSGDPPVPLVASFGEVTATRLKLTITDQSNPPLNVRSASFAAPARQIVIARPATSEALYRLFLGNPKADPPGYDFARNLPTRLDPPPTRLKLNPRRDNPDYRPEPKPLTERWPWFIYVVLSAISILLGLVIVNLAQTAIKVHDARRTGTTAPTGTASVRTESS